MTADILAQIGLIAGFFGMTFLLFRKYKGFSRATFLRKFLPGNNFLQKILMKLKILILKSERKIEIALKRLKETGKSKAPDPKYWQELRNTKNSQLENKPQQE